MTASTHVFRSFCSARTCALGLAAVASIFGCSSGDDHAHGAGTAGQSAVARAGSGNTTPSSGGTSGTQTETSGGTNAAGASNSNGVGGSAPGGGTTSSSGGSGGTRAEASGGTNAAGASAGGSTAAGAASGAGGRTSLAGVGGGNAAAGSATTGSAGQLGAGGATASGTPTLFWLDVSGKVESSGVANFAAKTLVPSAGQGSDGIAVDLAGGHIYWTDMGVPADNDGSVMRSDLDGSNVTTIVPAAGTYTPKQLKLEPSAQKLYWSDREGMRVMRANLDGSDVETLYASGTTDTDRQDDTRWCVGIAVDVAGGYFYWSQIGDEDGTNGSLRRAHLTMPSGDTDATRSDIEILYTGLAAPCDIDLDLDAGLLYWANRGDNTINRIPMLIPGGVTASTRTDRQIVVPNVTQAIGINLDHERGIVYYADAVGDVGRANLDGSDSKFLLTKSGAFTGIVLVDLPN